jgi:hypothetical protein
MTVMHTHHLIPKYKGGTDDPENLVQVTVEQHAELHFAAYLTDGRMEDWLAYNGLAGIIGHEECVSIAQSMAVSKANSERVCRPETREKHAANARRRSKPVLCHQTGEVYYSYPEAARQLGLGEECVRRVVRGQRNHTGGYTFEEVS